MREIGDTVHEGVAVTGGSSFVRAQADAGNTAEPIITVVVVEGHRLLHHALCDMLQQQSDFCVRRPVTESSVASQLALAEALGNDGARAPAVALLDVNLGELDGVLVCSRLSLVASDLRVIITGMTATHEKIADFVSAGAVAFVMDDASAVDYVRTIRQVARGEAVLPPALTRSLFAQIARGRESLTPPIMAESASLTVREREIISLLGEGLSNRDIAERLHIAIHTVKSHVHNVLEKLSLRSRLEVVALARVLEKPK
jgi:DNA-binding NarL/FixJ family response regulator